MKKIKTIVVSQSPPEDPNAIWLKDNKLFYRNNYGIWAELCPQPYIPPQPPQDRPGFPWSIKVHNETSYELRVLDCDWYLRRGNQELRGNGESPPMRRGEHVYIYSQNSYAPPPGLYYGGPRCRAFNNRNPNMPLDEFQGGYFRYRFVTPLLQLYTQGVTDIFIVEY